MNISNISRWRTTLLMATLCVCSGNAALADDTEILTGQIGDYAAPNILFMIDTSGSMGGHVLVDDENEYDPSVTYVGPYNDNDRLYYVLAELSGSFFYPDADYAAFGSYVNRPALACDAATDPLVNNGFFFGRVIQYDTQDGLWGFLEGENADPDVSGVDRVIECFADDGVHGPDDLSPLVYPVDGPVDQNGRPWTADVADPNRFDWSGYALRYAIFENNYLNWIAAAETAGAPVVKTRLEVVQGVTTNLIDRLASEPLDARQAFNVGLMRFSTSGQGGMVLKEVDNVAASSGALSTAIAGMTPSSNTPLSETLFEASQYYKGKAVTFGLNSTPSMSVAESSTNGFYNSPITASCQKNYIVLLTDGLPTSDTDANDLIRDEIGRECVGNCLDDLSLHLASTDVSTTLDEVQDVKTFSIGFFTDSTLLANTATGDADDGNPATPPGYFLANNVSALEAAFDAIFEGIGSDVATFTSPAVSVSSLNRLQNRDVLYFTMFQPATKGQPHWDGNLKAYFLGRPAGDATSDVAILDANRISAVNANGTFKDNSISIWSGSPDGPNVTEGGFVSRLAANRTIVTNVAGSDLSAGDNEIDAGNSAITAAHLGIPVPLDPTGAAEAEARRVELLRFASGENEDGSVRQVIGDPLHTEPLILTYSNDAEDLRLFFTTNDGFLHGIDPTPAAANGGDLEEFAFIPRELLPNLDLIERNPESLPGAQGTSNKLYGLDGPLTHWIENDTNFIVDTGETLYIYSAMRRGGDNYYGLKFGAGGRGVPDVAFTIGSNTAGLNRLGQTWSAAIPATVNLSGTPTEVLIFGGGYDARNDTTYNTGNRVDRGNAVYMVNPKTGAKIWSASKIGADLNLADMIHSIPSDVAVLDIDQDGVSDRMYVGDLGGQLWRFDMTDDGITGGRLAALGGATDAEQRRFYSPPRISRVLTEDQNFLALAVGSGWRAHPLATENDDRFYLIKDVNVFGAPLDENGSLAYPAPFTNTDLVEADEANPPDASTLGLAGGWYLELTGSGEKNLSPALVADNRIFFTTYLPESPAVTCDPTSVAGSGRLYGLDILTGLPALLNNDGSSIAFIPLDNTIGIPPAPQQAFVEPLCVLNCDADPDPSDGDSPQPITGTIDPITGEIGCFGAVSSHSLVIGFSTYSVGVCTAPRPTYWFETDEPINEL